MNSSQFKKNEHKKLCAIIGFKPADVQYLISDIDCYYNEWIENKKDTNGDFKKYKDGTVKKRTIRPSNGKLKTIQTRIKTRILEKIELPKNIHGGVKKRSNISNAKPHQGNKYQFITDLQDFYPNISSKNVYDTFIRLGYSSHFASMITKLTTWKHELPQGTPTSTHLANLVVLKMDYELIEFCNSFRITYTRFVDDLTFSSQKDFRPHLNTILDIIQSNGFKISYRKTSYKGNQNITGIDVFLHKIDAPFNLQKRAKSEQTTNSTNKPLTNYINNIRKTNKRKKASPQ